MSTGQVATRRWGREGAIIRTAPSGAARFMDARLGLAAGDALAIGAAVAALGQIASPRAAKALKQFHSRAPQALRATVADSILVCADGLLAKGERDQARELYALLSENYQPVFVRQASSRGLKACS